MKRRIVVLLLLALLGQPLGAGAEEAVSPAQGAEAVIRAFAAEYALTEDNFAVGWYDTVSGESCYYNGDAWMVAGSIYKLPLNMVYTDRLAAGEVAPGTLVNGYQVSVAMEASIIYSDNDSAQALRAGISGDLYEYRDALARYSGMALDQLPEGYYTENRMSPRFILGTLQYLWEHQEDYSELIEQMKQAHPGRFLQSGAEGCTVAHKYGYFEQALNDCGIVYTDRPFLLVVMTQSVREAEEKIAELCAALADYSLSLRAREEATEAVTPAPTAAPEPVPTAQLQPTPASTPVPTAAASPAAAEKAEEGGAVLPWLLGGGAVLGALAALALLRRGKRRGGRWVLVTAVVLLMAFFELPLARQEPSAPPAEEAAAAPAPPVTPTAAPQPSPTAASDPTPTPTPEPTPTPVSQWTLSFAGDCTIATLHEWQQMNTRDNMLYVIGEDMSYPLQHVKEIFESDDLTVVNLEGSFTTATAPKSKDYRFRADPAYAAVLTEGGVDCVSLANNHSGDYLDAGYADTKAALEAEGLAWTDETRPYILSLAEGPTLGLISFNAVEIDLAVGDVDGYMKRMTPAYTACRETGCDVVIALLHWGWEYRYEPEDWMVELAHRLAELGCDMVVGGHAHVLQPVEVYEGVPICYSLGNFCYGGHSDPDDKDSVIVRQSILRTAEGFTLGETTFLPCAISSTDSDNDFCPTPYAPGSAGYDRVLEKLGVVKENE